MAIDKRLQVFDADGNHVDYDILATDVDETLVDADGKLNLSRAHLAAYAHGEYFALGAVIYAISEYALMGMSYGLHMATNVALFMVAICYATWREKIDVKGLVGHILKRGRR